MSKKNRQHAAPVRIERPQIPQAAGVTIRNDSSPPMSQATDSPNPAKQPTNWPGWLGPAIGLLSAFIAGYGAYVSTRNAGITAENAKIAKSNYDRVAGHVRAKFVITGIKPDQKDLSAQLLEHSDVF